MEGSTAIPVTGRTPCSTPADWSGPCGDIDIDIDNGDIDNGDIDNGDIDNGVFML